MENRRSVILFVSGRILSFMSARVSPIYHKTYHPLSLWNKLLLNFQNKFDLRKGLKSGIMQANYSYQQKISYTICLLNVIETSFFSFDP